MLSFSMNSSAQTCGFGCLGLGGFYAGYSFQQYDPSGLNRYLDEYSQIKFYDPIPNTFDEFGTAKGFRLGANVLRTKYKSWLFSFKGFYQFLNESKTSTLITEERNYKSKLSLDLNYWGFGFDAGIFLFGFMDFKIVDAQLTFHSTKLNWTNEFEGTTDLQYRNRKTNLGFQLGSGLIFHLAGDYISLETTAAYTQFSVSQIEDENGRVFSYPSSENLPVDKFINKGGLTLLVQLNIGIPIY